MEISEKESEMLRKIASRWIDQPFLKKYTRLGEFYLKQIEMEKKYENLRNGQTEGAVSGK